MLAIHNFGAKVKKTKSEEDEDDIVEERPFLLCDFMSKLVQSGPRADVIFEVPDKDGVVKEIKAHRLILAASSKLFEGMLYPPKNSEGERAKVKLPLRIALTETKAEAFQAFLTCIYTDDTDIDSASLADLIKLAQKYQIEKLQLLCSEFMEKDVTIENALELFEMGPRLLGEQDFGMPFLRENMVEIVSQEGFLKLSKSRLEYLLKDDSLSIDEVLLYKGLLEWGKYQLTKGKPEEFKGKPDEIREVIKDLLPLIRFPCMELEDIANTVGPSELLDEKQMLLLFSYCALSSEEERSKFSGLEFNNNPRTGGKRLKYTSILDTGGLMYLIGTNGGKTTYDNPVRAGKVIVKVSSSGGSPVEHIADRNPGSYAVENSFGSDRNPWLSFDFKGYLIRPTEYVVCQDQDHFIQNWRFEGKEKGKSEWVLIQEYKNDRTITDSPTHRAVFKVKTGKLFAELRLYVTGPSHKGQPNFDITYMEFYGYYKGGQ